jgi:hypothetical protein
MPHPYDASTKYLVQTRLADWLPFAGRPTRARVEIIDADLATVTAAADRVLRVHDEPPWLLHLELQSSRDPDLVANLHLYNALLERRHGPPVRTVVVLLRRSADAPEISGVLQRGFAAEPPYLLFRYQAVRVWQQPVDTFLSGGLGILPLAPLSDVAEADLPAVIAKMQERINREATLEEAGTLWTAADVLMGLRYQRTLVDQLMQGVHGMEDSVTYQAIVEKGVIRARQEDILRLGGKRFGAPSSAREMAVRGITDVDRLARMIDRLLDVSSWEDLLATP